MVNEQIEYRELLVQMTRRDLLLRYKQTIMGFGWAIFMPLVNTADLLGHLHARGADRHGRAVSAVRLLRAARLELLRLVAALRGRLRSRATASLVTKIYFPREIFPFSAVLVSLVDSVVGSVVLVALMVYYHVGVGAGRSCCCRSSSPSRSSSPRASRSLLAMANLFYRDVKYLFEIVITVWMFATSVVYPIERVGGRLGRLLRFNPMTPIIDAFRAVVLHGGVPDPAPIRGRRPSVSLVALLVALGGLPPGRVHVRGEHLSERSIDRLRRRLEEVPPRRAPRQPARSRAGAGGASLRTAADTRRAPEQRVLGGRATSRSKSARARRSASSARTAPASPPS